MGGFCLSHSCGGESGRVETVLFLFCNLIKEIIRGLLDKEIIQNKQTTYSRDSKMFLLSIPKGLICQASQDTSLVRPDRTPHSSGQLGHLIGQAS